MDQQGKLDMAYLDRRLPLNVFLSCADLIIGITFHNLLLKTQGERGHPGLPGPFGPKGEGLPGPTVGFILLFIYTSILFYLLF